MNLYPVFYSLSTLLRSNCILVLLPLLTSISFDAWSQISTNEYQMHCYCGVDHYTPDHIVSLENNREILLQLQKSATVEELRRSGLKFSESQIELLKKWRLIKVDKQKLQTNFPILKGAEATQFYEESSRLASVIINKLRPSFVEYVQVLNQHRLNPYSFAITFSYLLDGQVWKQFESEMLIEKKELDKEHTLWNGEFWMIERKSTYSYGTSSFKTNNMTLFINWDNESLGPIRSLLLDTESLDMLINKISANEKITDAYLYKRFKNYGLIGEKGKQLIPILDENNQNRITQVSEKLSKEIAHELKKLPLEAISQRYGFVSMEQTLIILYHEIMSEIIEDLTAHNIIIKPRFFEEKHSTDLGNVSDVVFLVKHKKMEE